MLRPTRPLRRWLRWAAWALAATWALYLVAMNVFVRTRLLRTLLSTDPMSLRVDYASAYSIVPGRVHVTGLHIRGRDSNIEWILVIDRCDFTVRFADFIHRRFHADDVHGDGLSLRVRQREPSFNPDEMAALPPVPGFSDPPYSGPKPPPITDARYNLWSVWLEGVVADHVREVWIDTLRYSGDVRIQGRWYFKPIRWLEVGPAVLEVRDLEVARGEHEPWISQAKGRLVVTVHPGDVRDYAGGKVIDYVSVSGTASGQLQAARPLDRIASGRGVNVLGLDAPFDARLAVDHGVLREGMQVHVGPSDASVRSADLDLHATVDLDAVVGEGGVGQAHLTGNAVQVARDGKPLAEAAHIAVGVWSRELDLARPFSDTAYAADLTGGRADHLAPLLPRLPALDRLRLDSGVASADVHLVGVVSERSARGGLHLEIAGLRAGGLPDQLLVTGDMVADVVLDASLLDARVELSGSRVILTRARLDVLGATAITAARVAVHAQRAVIASAGVLGRIEVDVPDARVPQAQLLGAFVSLPSDVSVYGGAGAGRLRGDVDLGDGTVAGDAQLALRGLRVRLGTRGLDGDLALAMLARRASGSTDLAGSYATFRETRADGWWGRIDAVSADVRSSGGLRMRARVRVAARDASPITAVIESHAALAAQLALGIVPTSDLQATGELVVAPSLVAVRSATAEASGFGLALEASKVGKDPSMAMSLVVGGIHAGVGVTRSGTSVVLAGIDSWFGSRVTAMRAAERRYE